MTPIIAGCGCWLDIFFYVGVIVFLAGVVWVVERFYRERP